MLYDEDYVVEDGSHAEREFDRIASNSSPASDQIAVYTKLKKRQDSSCEVEQDL